MNKNYKLYSRLNYTAPNATMFMILRWFVEQVTAYRRVNHKINL